MEERVAPPSRYFAAALRAHPEAGNLRFPVMTPPFAGPSTVVCGCLRRRSARTVRSGTRMTSFAMHQTQIASITKSCRITR